MMSSFQADVCALVKMIRTIMGYSVVSGGLGNSILVAFTSRVQMKSRMATTRFQGTHFAI